jgi:hypothetical protein
MMLIDDSSAFAISAGNLHPRAQAGIRLFNQGRYFEAHEELEAAWRDEPGPVRTLYQGILQVGVGYYHAERGNPSGALKLFRRCHPLLESFPNMCMGINLAKLIQDYHDIESYIKQYNIQPGTKLDPGMFKSIDWTDPQRESMQLHDR